MAAEALLRRNAPPTEAEIREALSGNICRCTGYVKIIESVQAAAAERMSASAHEAARCRGEAVGVRQPLIDGIEKVTGRARFTADLPAASALVGAILRSPLAHGEIRAHRHSRARALPGVRAVITGADCDVPYGVLPIAQNEYPLARERVRYRGEPIAAVAADDEATARAALDLIEVDIAAAAGVLRRRGGARRRRRRCCTTNKPGNLEREVEQEFGDVEAGFAAADLVREAALPLRRGHARADGARRGARRVRRGARPADAALDDAGAVLRAPHARAVPEDGRVAAYASSSPSSAAASATAPRRSISRSSPALLARAARGTVKLELSREETLITHRGRPETDVRLRLGLKKTGEITAVDCEVIQRGGAYAGYGLVTILYAGALLHAIYRLPACALSRPARVRNTPPCGAMRGHGSVDMRHAFESLLDEMAEELGLDPIAVRRANLLPVPYRTLNDLQVNSCGLAECLDRVEQASGWRERRGKLPRGRGLGMAARTT